MSPVYRTTRSRLSVGVVSAMATLSFALLPSARCGDATEAVPVHPRAPVTATASHAASSVTAEDALQRLLDGNARFVAGKTTHPDQSVERRASLAKGQAPFAIVLTCSDSRVAPELLFDQGLGDLFVIRNAGNLLNDHVIGSMEYAVEHLHVSLIIVVGHEKCGAVSAAVAGGDAPGHLRSVVESIAPAVAQATQLPGDKVENAVRANAQYVVDTLSHVEPVIKELAASHHLKLVAARYDLTTGQVELLKPSQPISVSAKTP